MFLILSLYATQRIFGELGVLIFFNGIGCTIHRRNDWKSGAMAVRDIGFQ